MSSSSNSESNGVHTTTATTATTRTREDAFRGKATGGGASLPIDEVEVRRALSLLSVDPTLSLELRGLPSGRSFVWRGDQQDELVKAARALASDKGVYYGLNPNSIPPGSRNRAAKKADILCRCWLLIDIDAGQAADQNSTDQEKAAAYAVLEAIELYLVRVHGWPEFVRIDSGNAYHLLARIRMENDEAARLLIKDFLKALAARFNLGTVKVDIAVHDAPRIAKLPGTWARKGPHSAERPHRMARIEYVPPEIVVVTAEQIQAVTVALQKEQEEQDQQEQEQEVEPINRAAPFLGKAQDSKDGRSSDDDGRDYAKAALESECQEVLSTPEGDRNNYLNIAAMKMGQLVATGAISEQEATAALREAALAAGLGEQETERTITSGMAFGMTEPRKIPEREQKQQQQQEKSSSTKSRKSKKGRISPLVALKPYVPFPVQHLPPVAREFVASVSEAMEVDSAFIALPVLATLAGAIGNARALQLKRSWSEPCCLWTLAVGNSGDRKSAPFSAATDPLTSFQYDLHDSYRDEFCRWENADKNTRGTKPEEPPDLTTGDTTIEALGEILRVNRRGVLVARDELDGWFQGMVRYKGLQGGSDRSQWLELYRAGKLTCHRITREKGALYIRRALASITGTIQPGVLARCLDRAAMDAGLGARFLLAMPDKQLHTWTEADISESIQSGYDGLIESLLALPMADPKKGVPVFVGLSREAKSEWIEWYNEWSVVQFHAEGADAACFAKIEGAAARLMLIHWMITLVADGDQDTRQPISLNSARAGIDLAKWFAAEAIRIYGMLAETEEQTDQRQLVELIKRKGGEITVRELQKSNFRRYPNSEAARATLTNLVDANQAEWVKIPSERPDYPRDGVRLTVVSGEPDREE